MPPLPACSLLCRTILTGDPDQFLHFLGASSYSTQWTAGVYYRAWNTGVIHARHETAAGDKEDTSDGDEWSALQGVLASQLMPAMSEVVCGMMVIEWQYCHGDDADDPAQASLPPNSNGTLDGQSHSPSRLDGGTP